MFVKSIPRIKPYFDSREISALRLASLELEEELALAIRTLLGTKHFMFLPYGRSAIYAFCRAALSPEGQVLLPAYTCSAVPSAVLAAGLSPRWVDVSLRDGNMDLQLLEREASRGTAEAILLTHMFGNSAPHAEYERIKERFGIKYILIDAALGFGSYDRARHVAAYPDAAILSFALGKHLSFIKGGGFTSNDTKLFSQVKTFFERQKRVPSATDYLRKLALLSSIYMTYQLGLYPLAHFLYYRTPFLDILGDGPKGRPPAALPADALTSMNQLQFAVGKGQLDKWKEISEKRKMLQKEYLSEFGEWAIINHSVEENILSHFSIRTANRQQFYGEMRQRGIYLEGSSFEYAIPELTNFKRFNRTSYPQAGRLSREVVNLPLYPELTAKEVKYIIEQVKICLGGTPLLSRAEGGRS